MSSKEIYEKLKTLSCSLYKGVPIPEIEKLLSNGEANRYLLELCMENAKKRT